LLLIIRLVTDLLFVIAVASSQSLSFYSENHKEYIVTLPNVEFHKDKRFSAGIICMGGISAFVLLAGYLTFLHIRKENNQEPRQEPQAPEEQQLLPNHIVVMTKSDLNAWELATLMYRDGYRWWLLADVIKRVSVGIVLGSITNSSPSLMFLVNFILMFYSLLLAYNKPFHRKRDNYSEIISLFTITSSFFLLLQPNTSRVGNYFGQLCMHWFHDCWIFNEEQGSVGEVG